MTNTQKAFILWAITRPKDGGTCCTNEHRDPNEVEKSDEAVCARELAWRKYVRIRDSH